MAANESAPLLSRRLRGNNLTMYLLAGIGLIAVSSLLLVSDHRPRANVLLQTRPSRRAQLAQALIMKGKDLMDAGKADLRMAQLIEGNVFQGSMLEGNATDSSKKKCTGDVLECHGVNLDNWPHYHEIPTLPGYVSPPEGGRGGAEADENSSATEIPDDVADYDLYNRRPLQRAGVHVGRWFWEDEDDGIDDESSNSNETSAAEEAADEEVERIMQKLENRTTPEERLSRLGVKLDGMPWDNEDDYRYHESRIPDDMGDPMDYKSQRVSLHQVPSRAARTPKSRMSSYKRGLDAYREYQADLARMRSLSRRK
ncbi:hypothetical protein GUITHDRAFT_109802 [Guillardia theta CCMP2712]|uniref:Uncharacterized protein n=1 Tax=Guillardia theta (strain CCMP2712) TaxID=905079 RepID=L1J743_GUITC|nr:hypothetical protein GUITHDRAFT_109802 [Guillardia theta CCMP2712]EKX44353.1 hypothetical protein GUITHDRAFT_109802 [Guillardia theta CCMP2712]|eukprot:XP_005831333.1 hypothetical protein GUITHDRAFT_109802 [Guillardia theta CCMP2712]